METFSWIFASLGPVWGPIALVAAGYLVPIAISRLNDSPIKTILLSLLAKKKPATPTPSPSPLPSTPDAPLKTVLDKLRTLFKGHPAAEILAEDPGHDVSRLAMLRMFADAYAAHLEHDVLTQANLLSRFRAPNTAGQVPGGPPIVESAPHSPPAWPGGVNVTGVSAAGTKLASLALLFMCLAIGSVGCSKAGPTKPAVSRSSMPAIAPAVACSKCHEEKLPEATASATPCVCGSSCKCNPGVCPRCPAIAVDPPDLPERVAVIPHSQ